MDDEMALFGDDPRAASPPADAAPTLIAVWQRDLIRKALDARGLESMDDRQRAVEVALGRDVANLRDLTHDEAMRVLTRLGESGPSVERKASLWESRDEDTWIDRL